MSVGQRLYELYAESQLRLNNCEVESWSSLDAEEQAAWGRTAHEFTKWALTDNDTGN
jgi:hypothetical protein